MNPPKLYFFILCLWFCSTSTLLIQPSILNSAQEHTLEEIFSNERSEKKQRYLSNIRRQDSLALVALYSSTNGLYWRNSWNLSQPMSTWQGIIINPNGCVTSIILNDNNLVGTLPSELGNLTELESLFLNDNSISGSLHSEYGNLTKLKFFSAINNQINGNIPSELGDLINLEDLFLANNQLSGNIPNELGDLESLINLALDNNNLTGNIPAELGDLSNLIELDLSDNQLSGLIPNELGQLQNLEILELYLNRLTGSIPNELGDLTNLQVLYLHQNQLSGCYPEELMTFCDLGFSTDFVRGYNFIENPDLLWAGDFERYCEGERIGASCDDGNPNTENDVITADCGCMGTPVNPCRERDSLALVDFYNALDGDNWVDNSSLSWDLSRPMVTWNGVSLNSEGCVTELVLQNWRANGTLTESIGQLSELQVLNLNAAQNTIFGNIPTSICNLSNLEILRLGYKDFTGSIPDCINQLTELQILDLRYSEQIIGEIPTGIGALTKLEELYLTNLELLEGEIPPEIGNCISLRVIQMENCVSINGSIPETIGNLTQLEVFHTRYNQNITGNIPTTIGNCTALKILNLSRNNLTGSMPSTLGNCTQLEELWLYANELSGEIPETFCNLTSLQRLILNENQLIGAIPSCLGQLPEIVNINLATNNLSGCFPETFISICLLGEEVPDQYTPVGYSFVNNPALPWEGDFTRFCTGEAQINAFCDDSDVSTNNDSITNECICIGNAREITVATSSTDIICNGVNDGTFTITVTGGIAPYQFYWSNSGNTNGPRTIATMGGSETVEELAAGNYIITVTDSSEEQESDIVLVEILESNNGLLEVMEITLNPPSANGSNDGSIALTISGGTPPYTYQWSNGANTSSIENLVNGVYSVTVNDANGCMLMDEYELEDPPIEDNPCRERDSLALVALYNATHENGEWTNEWDLELPMDTWYGVTLNAEGCVTCLDLDGNPDCSFGFDGGNSLSGSIPEQIGQLSNLQRLSLGFNQLTGEIPTQIWQLSNLRILYLFGNQLTGEIPTQIGQLSNLQYLDLGSNQLTGEIPTQIGQLSNLQFLHLPDNQLTGEIPIQIGQLSNLQYLSLFNNQLTGEIPTQIGQLSNLEHLSLFNNQLTGEIPTQIGQLSNLQRLSLSFNQLTGEIPTQIGQLSNLQFLHLPDNQLTGEIPIQIGQLSNLQRLLLSRNQLTGEIPTQIEQLTNLQDLYLFGNQLTGEIPTQIGQLSNLQDLYLHDNQLTGEIPLELNIINTLTHLSLSSNQLNGCIPDNLQRFCNFEQQEYNQFGVFNDDGYNFSNNPRLPWQGDFSRFCAGEDQIGASCDDGDPNTENDVITADCGCQGCLPQQTTLTESICADATYIVGEQTFSETGEYTISLQSVAGCDSTITLNLEVRPPLESTTTASICMGDRYDFNEQSYTTTGSYFANLTSIGGCDSTAFLNLQVVPMLENHLNTQICTGESYPFNGRILTESGNYSDTLRTSNGCDSMITHLTLSVTATLTTDIETTICEGENYFFGNENYTESGNYQDTLSSQAGCDSIVRLNLEVLPTILVSLIDTICAGDSYPMGMEVYMETGWYEQTFSTLGGCDSTMQLQLTVIDPITIGAAVAGENITLCSEYQYQLNALLPSNTNGKWTSSNGIVFDNPQSPNAIVQDLQPGDNLLTWALSTTDCPNYASDEIIITVEENLPLVEEDKIELKFADQIINGNVLDNDQFEFKEWNLTIEEEPKVGILQMEEDGFFTYTLTGISEQDRFVYRLTSIHCPELTNTATVQVRIIDIPKDISDGFTPNEDGINDQFVIPEIRDEPEKYPDNELVVFNRWGSIVYQQQPYDNTWKGTLMDTGQNLSAGTYYYIIRLDIGEGEIRYGQVTIIR